MLLYIIVIKNPLDTSKPKLRILDKVSAANLVHHFGALKPMFRRDGIDPEVGQVSLADDDAGASVFSADLFTVRGINSRFDANFQFNKVLLSKSIDLVDRSRRII